MKYLHQDPLFREKIDALDYPEYEIIVDYKGMKRPPVNSPSWQHHNWQVLTYAWLRSMQPESRPVLTGILFYLNELSLFKEDLKELKREVEERNTDIMPPENDLVKILQWNARSNPPLISEAFKIRRILMHRKS
ncbi:hypothetical protein [Methanobacterium sp.]|uniref:hypothetical protein n=1 Tax=Methanobacterium sp. TaxID=2164 RepID=UPI003158948B